jgi:hypothetical protein
MPTTRGSHQGIYRIAQREKLCAEFIRSSKEVTRVRICLKCYLPFREINYFRAMTDLYDVLTDIHEQPRLKQILWRDGISVLVSRVYEILNAASFNVGNLLCCKLESQKNNHSLVNF